MIKAILRDKVLSTDALVNKYFLVDTITWVFILMLLHVFATHRYCTNAVFGTIWIIVATERTQVINAILRGKVLSTDALVIKYFLADTMTWFLILILLHVFATY